MKKKKYKFIKKQEQERRKQTSQIIKAIAIIMIVFLVLFIVDTSISSDTEFSMFELVSGVGWVAGVFQADSAEIFTYVVNIWQPPSGGDNCLKCNDLRYGCSEYQCHSLGQKCEWINNQQESGLCVEDDPTDITPPIIFADDSYLREGYSFSVNNAIAPPEKGVFVIYEEGDNHCLEPFKNLTLGIYTDGPAVCKSDIKRQPNYDSMRFETEQGSIPAYNHTIFLPSSAFPSASALSTLGIVIEDDSYDNRFYFRCEDTNGNANLVNFLIEFCVEAGPDLNPPIIEGTSFTTNPAYVSYNTTERFFEIYTSESADCKWDFQDLEYDSMSNNMTWCSQNYSETFNNNSLQHGCNGTITGIQNQDHTNYFIKCRDQPWLVGEEAYLRNANDQPYVLTILGAPPLQIDEILINNKPNNSIIEDNTDVVQVELKVKTSAGALEGQATCSYDLNGLGFVDFIETGTTESTQSVWLDANNTGIIYEIPIQCKDIAGNIANDLVRFTLRKDVIAPEVSRVYYETGKLKIITNEPAECVYSILGGCGYLFEDGTEIQSSEEGLEHFLDWDTEIDMYVKCRDKYGNQPIVNNEYVCSIVVRGSDSFSS